MGNMLNKTSHHPDAALTFTLANPKEEKNFKLSDIKF